MKKKFRPMLVILVLGCGIETYLEKGRWHCVETNNNFNMLYT